MIFVLFTVTTGIAYYTYQNSKLKLLSPTFWTSVMFASFSFVYCITLSDMKSDISVITLEVIIASICVTAFGEYVGIKIKFRLKGDCIGENKIIKTGKSHGEIEVKRWKVYILTIIFLFIAVRRYKNLVSVVGVSSDGIRGVFDMMTSARSIFIASNRQMVLGTTLENQFVYICEITVYIIIYIYVYNYFLTKKKSLYLLLPLIPDIIIRFITTSRTSFMILVFSAVISVFAALYKQKGPQKIKIPKGLVIGVCLFAIIFIIYGRNRNNAYSIPMINYVQMYTCASIFGLDYILVNGWQKNPYFGFYTLQNVYDMLGIERSTVLTWTKMIDFTDNGYHSNIYTSLFDPIVDYSVLGMLVLRAITAIIAAKLIYYFLSDTKGSHMSYIIFYFVIMVLYCYMYSSVGDVFKDVFLNPDLMIRYLLYSIILVKGYLRPRYSSGKLEVTE